jgi:hypothetical protein
VEISSSSYGLLLFFLQKLALIMTRVQEPRLGVIERKHIGALA